MYLGTKLYLGLGILSLFFGCGPGLPPDIDKAYASLPDLVDYNFHVRPVLSDRCYACHGPDEQARDGGFRLDVESEAKSTLESGIRPIQPGSVRQSNILARILTEDPELVMPPPESKLSLSDHEKALLVKWVEQGAKFKPHWSFIPPAMPELPSAIEGWKVNNEIDLFIQARLLDQGLTPSPLADKERLLKRVFMDLTGLPPAISSLDAFLENEDESAFESIVDSLLSSDACAERLALEWMDIARYADSHGMHADGWRNMWPWRDWVISAFNSDMPYDEFVTAQLAGDLFPQSTRDQIIATAFHRNHPMTAEGGAIDEEFRLEYVADRTITTATAMMGITMECARCHDHKFDPVSQKEFYQMSAFFNNVREVGMTGDDGNYGPLLQLTSEDAEKDIEALKRQIEKLNGEIDSEAEKIKTNPEILSDKPKVNLGNRLAGHIPFEKKSEYKKQTIFDQNKQVYSNGNPVLKKGKTGNAVFFDYEYDEVYLKGIGAIDVQVPLSVSMWINTSKKQQDKTQVLIGNAGDKNNFWRGWDFYLEDDNRLSCRLISALPHNLIHVRSRDSISLDTWAHVAFTYDGSGSAYGIKLYIDGYQADAEVVYDRLYKNIRTIGSGAHEEIERPLRLSKSYRSFTGDNGVFKGMLDDVRLYNRAISALEMAYLAKVDRPDDVDELRLDHEVKNSKRIQMLEAKRSKLVASLIAIYDTIPEMMVMEEMASPRPTFVLNRGLYDAPMDKVDPATPRAILPFPDDLPKNRLGLAHWLFHPDHPLTARATTNRYWQMIFGKGIVKTARDFGSQGSLPSHPELLDLLAIYLRDRDWDIKALLKVIVMSNTYQQSSAVTADQMENDPENTFLSRSPSYRWPAELIRDNALAASGLLVRKVGGPSVKPYQPEGLWIEKGNFSHRLLRYEPDVGENLYRRSLYTFVKRTSPHPAMTVFDAPNRDVCTVTREITNTPLQALVLLNDPQFVEASRILGERMLREGGEKLNDQITLGFRLLTGRTPTSDEVVVLKGVFSDSKSGYEDDPSAAKTLLQIGDMPYDVRTPVIDNAAMAIVASTIMNMDESYMKR